VTQSETIAIAFTNARNWVNLRMADLIREILVQEQERLIDLVAAHRVCLQAAVERLCLPCGRP